MIAIDSNILIRYFAQDDPVQAQLATDLIENQLTPTTPGLITIVTVYETVWVMRTKFRRTDAEIRPIIAELIAAPNLVVERNEEVALALAGKSGIADTLLHLIGRDLGAKKTVTFDRKFARLDGVELLA